MKHLSLPKFHFTKHLLIVAGVAVIVGLVLIGLAQAQHDKQVSRNKAIQATLVQKQHDTATQKQINDLQAAVKAEDAKVVAVCSYVKQLAVKSRSVVVPQVCTSTI